MVSFFDKVDMRKDKILFIYNFFFARLPGVRGMRFRLWLLRKAGIEIGRNCKLQPGTEFRISNGGKVLIGDNAKIRGNVIFECNNDGRIYIGEHFEVNHGTLLSANNGARIIIGDNVRIAHMVSMKCSTHEVVQESDISHAGKSVFKDIEIGNGSWVCASSVILPGVTIGERCIVAAGAVVTKNVDNDALVAGCPAVIKKHYFSFITEKS